MKRALLSAAALTLCAMPALAQTPTPRITVEPYVGYAFFGQLPDDRPSLDADIALGGRAAYHLSPQWGVFGNFQRSTPQVADTNTEVTVDQWAAGVEFSYVPRGGAEGMLPLILEAGLGQTRYGGGAGVAQTNDLAVKLGVSSAFRLTPNIGIRYGVDDYISNYNGDEGVVNQFVARVGAEIRF